MFNDQTLAIRTVTLAAAAVGNALKTSIASSAAPATYTGVALNGSIGSGRFAVPQTVSVTTSAHAGSYIITTPITVKGTDAFGNAISDTLTLTAVNGGETIVGVKAFMTVTEIDVPAMNDALGAFTFGVYDILLTPQTVARRIRASASGSLVIGYYDGSSDTLPSATGEQHDLQVMKVSGTTSIGFTLYL